jgi:serine/threonine protein phosphatase PrpC
MSLFLRYSASSHGGYVRDNNEDSVYAGRRLLALADGMGGHAAGEVASSLVVAELIPLDHDEPSGDPVAELRQATSRANVAIARYVAEHPEADGMGTTLTAMLFAGDRLGLVHVGDSRAYLFRDGSLTQLTKDDTMVQSLVDGGQLAPEEVWTHPQRSVVMQVLTGRELDPWLEVREVRPGDRYLLCSDGLSDVVPAETVGEALSIPDPQQCTGRLLQLALRAGSRDNVTCIVADVTDRDLGYDIPIVGGAAGDEGVLVRR